MTEAEIKVEARFRVLEEEVEALQSVIAWLLARFPDDAARFLSAQANGLDNLPRFATTVAVLDELSEDLAEWRALEATGLDGQQE